MKVSTAYISTAHSVSYKPRTNDEKPPDRHVDIDCSRLNWPAKKVVIAPTTAPSMMPTKGTTIDEVTATRRSTPKKIIVPMKANTEATSMRTMGGDPGMTMKTKSNPSPDHWVVPAVVGSTNLFWVIICMMTPDRLMAMAAKIRARVRGTREMKNISR